MKLKSIIKKFTGVWILKHKLTKKELEFISPYVLDFGGDYLQLRLEDEKFLKKPEKGQVVKIYDRLGNSKGFGIVNFVQSLGCWKKGSKMPYMREKVFVKPVKIYYKLQDIDFFLEDYKVIVENS